MKGEVQVDPVARFSPTLCRLFRIYLHRYFSKNFHAVRTSGPRPAGDKPLIVYTNHPSWWDPIHLLLLSGFETPRHRMFGPFDRVALERYAFFKKIGCFGVDPTTRGAAEFLRVAQRVLASPGGSLWITAEGKFTDPRARPVRLKPGLAHLVRRLETATVVPLAIEYPFWNERYPEALTRFGDPIEIAPGDDRPTGDWTELFEARLTTTMDALAADAETRDPARFRTLLSGRVGVGGIYDRFRRARAMVRGETFDAAHQPEGKA